MRRRIALPMTCAVLALAPTATASATDGLPARAASVEREHSVLIKAEPGSAAGIAARHGVKVLRAFPQIGWAEVSLGADPDATLDALNADTDVQGVDVGRDDEEFKPQFQPRDSIWTATAQMPFGNGGVALPWNYTIANFPAAWDRTTGSDTVVVAVLDSGIRRFHPEFTVGTSRLLAGYDFVSEVEYANDGSGLDPDPTDPGDWVSQQDKTQFPALSPPKNRAGNRVYRARDLELIALIRHLVHDERYTLEGARKRIDELRQEGAAAGIAASALERSFIRSLKAELEDILELLAPST